MKNTAITLPQIKSKILTIRGQQVMLDRDLAEFYGVKTKRLNEAVKRNIKRFPTTFRFQLTKREIHELVAICDRFKPLKHSTNPPYAFTEQGVAMLSAVLKSGRAIEVSIKIMDAFVLMRHLIKENSYLFEKLYQLEKKQLITDEKLEVLLTALESNKLKFKSGIFYDGQVFDAYVLLTKLVRQAKKSIILIDNYINLDTLLLLSKRKPKVSCTIYTNKLTSQLKLDLKKHNTQYPPINIKTFTKSHDRFLILDEKTTYLIGASLKDAGKKWFALVKLSIDVKEMIRRLEGENS